MQTVSGRKDFLAGWRDLVKEIAELEQLIADAGKPEDVYSIWSLHLLHSTLKAKRQMLKDYMNNYGR